MDSVDIRKEKISRLFDSAREVLAFNMAGGTDVMNESKKIYYTNSQEILNYCMSITPKVIFKQHYHTKDFTIIMFK